MDFVSIISFVFVLLFGYVVGSINFSIIISKKIGKFDIHTKGSGNAGGTNVARTMGAKYGILVILIEILKCFLVCLFCRFVFPVDPFSLGEIGPIISGFAAGLGCLVGNIFPLFHGFGGGGKGVTVSAGLLFVADFRIALILLALFIIIFLTTKMVSAGSIVCAVGIPVSIAVKYHSYDYWYILFAFALVLAAVVIFRHRKNIVRIVKGEENKFSFGHKKCK